MGTATQQALAIDVDLLGPGERFAIYQQDAIEWLLAGEMRSA